MAYRFFSTLVILMCSSIFVLGQGLGKKANVDGQIRYEIKDGKLHLEAYCENQTNKSLTLNYKLNIEQRSHRNNSVSNSQGGKKEVAAMDSILLSSSSLSWREGSSVKVTLDIYHRKKRLDTDILELSKGQEKEKSEK